MTYFSTKNHSIKVTLKDAIMKGLAEDGGLFLPREISRFSDDFILSLNSLSFPETAFFVAKELLKGEVPDTHLREIVNKSITFDAPLIQIEPHVFSLELFHGPSLSFKDFGARFMAQLFRYFLKDSSEKLNILVATSGDTGSAVAHGFLDIPNIHVWILYPKGNVSPIQEQQIATLGKNITAIEVDGTFDDCQRMVKEAFKDSDLRSKMSITSANSINIARLIPQTFYYFYSYAKLKDKTLPTVFSIPCGNYGNITAGFIAKRMGLPIDKFVVSTNRNNIIPLYLETGNYSPRASIKTLSNAMDVGNPSNFDRIQDLYHHNLDEIRQEIFARSYSDTQTQEAIKQVYIHTGYILDPHGAVAYLGLKEYLSDVKTPINGIFHETAHPAKFLDIVEPCIGVKIKVPKRLKVCLEKDKQNLSISPNYPSLKAILIR